MREPMDQELRDFLKALDESDINVTDWEAQFIEGNLENDRFSPKQREIVTRLIEKYGVRLGIT
jgi:hypothetical protein